MILNVAGSAFSIAVIRFRWLKNNPAYCGMYHNTTRGSYPLHSAHQASQNFLHHFVVSLRHDYKQSLEYRHTKAVSQFMAL